MPIASAPASQRPYGFVFTPARYAGRVYLNLTAYGERHAVAGGRSVYERAHYRLHGGDTRTTSQREPRQPAGLRLAPLTQPGSGA